MVLIDSNRTQLILSIAGWYISGAILVSANKIMFDYLKMGIPLLVTTIHFSLTGLVIFLVKHRFSNLVGVLSITRSEFLRHILPVALCTAGDVGLSNMAYSRLPISVMTVLKSSAPVCIYFASVVAGLENFRWRTTGVCIIIATSIGFAIPTQDGDRQQEYRFISGLFIITIAVICLALRWVMIQKLSRQYTSIQLIYLVQPVSALLLMPLALIFEVGNLVNSETTTHSMVDMLIPLCLVIGSGFAALILLFSEFQIVHHTSSLTLSIGGIGKEIVTLVLSFIVFGESFTTQQVIAISVSLLGILIYARMRVLSPDGYQKHSKSMVVIDYQGFAEDSSVEYMESGAPTPSNDEMKPASSSEDDDARSIHDKTSHSPPISKRNTNS